MTARILTLDIETAPATALVFGQRHQEISNIQIIKPDRILGIGAKWLDSEKVEWRSEYHHSTEVMVRWIRDLLDAADIAVHFNGGTFDMPWIRRLIAEHGLTPYSPLQEVDLLRIVRKQFRFMSNKLENIVHVFGVGEKMKHSGFQMWRDIEVGDEDAQRKAWALMRRYCKVDVQVEEALYLKLLPYIPNHPNMGLYVADPADGVIRCARCTSNNLRADGYRYTSVAKYPRFQCRDCGKWGQEKKAVAIVEGRSVPA
jgi:DNA polymerase elongation subunit (family B)